MYYIVRTYRMNLEQKIANKKSYHCKNCEYTTNNKFDFSKHLLTPKHIKRTELCDLGQIIATNRNDIKFNILIF